MKKLTLDEEWSNLGNKNTLEKISIGKSGPNIIWDMTENRKNELEFWNAIPPKDFPIMWGEPRWATALNWICFDAECMGHCT